MKKTILLLTCILTLVLASCGSRSGRDEAAATTFELLEDGTVVHTIVEKNTGDYPEEEMKSFFESEIAAYNEPYGEENERISLDDFEIREDGTIYASMTYASVADYAAFNDVVCYTGKLKDAVKAGYSFEKDMSAANGGTIVGFTLPAEYPSLNVLVLQESMEVKVPGTITAFSSLVSKSESGNYSIAYAPDERLPEYFRTVNLAPEYIVYKENISQK